MTLMCGSCKNLCGEGHDFCFKCGKNVMASQRILVEDFKIDEVSDVLNKLGWDAHVHDGAIAVTGPGFYIWHCYVVEDLSLLVVRSSWMLEKGIPVSQILEHINQMNKKAWQTTSYLIEYDDGDRALWVSSATPISSTFDVYSIDRLTRMADEEATRLIHTSRIGELLS